MKYKILAVDDNKTNLLLIGQLIKKHLSKSEPISCTDPERVYDLASEHKPDVILLDIQMPKLNGFEVCKILKSNNNTNYSTYIAENNRLH